MNKTIESIEKTTLILTKKEMEAIKTAFTFSIDNGLSDDYEDIETLNRICEILNITIEN